MITLLFIAAVAHAASDSSLSIKNPQQETVRGEDVDNVLTNKKMRAESGSKSKYSMSVGLGYSGGSLEKPFAERRPNIAEGTGATAVSTMGGSVSGKYSLSTQKAVMAGVGMRWITPFQEGVPEDFKGNQFDVDNPSVTYQYVYKWGGIQSVAQANAVYYTASNLVKKGYVTTGGISQNNAYQIPGTKATMGVHGYVGLGYFDSHTAENKADQSDYSIGITPFLEYQLSERFNLRTSSNLFVSQHIRSKRDPFTFTRQKVTQNFGLGISITRDLFLSPSVEFVVNDIRSDRTTVSLGANANLF